MRTTFLDCELRCVKIKTDGSADVPFGNTDGMRRFVVLLQA